MSNQPVETELSRPVRVGRSGYQLFSATWPDGNTNFYARIGHYYEKKETGETYIIPKMYAGGGSDHICAAREADEKLEFLRNAQGAAAKGPSNAISKLNAVGTIQDSSDSEVKAA